MTGRGNYDSVRREWTDRELLEMLDMRADGMTMGQIAKHFRAGRSSVLGVVNRVKNAAGPPDGHDGTMPDGWWRAGLDVPYRAPR